MNEIFPLICFLDSKWVQGAIPPALLVALMLIVEIGSPGFLTGETLRLLLANTAVLFILATGVTFVILIGGIDLSIQAVARWPVSSWRNCCRRSARRLSGRDPVRPGLRYVSGIVHVRLRVPSFVATLATGGVVDRHRALGFRRDAPSPSRRAVALNTAWINATVAGMPVVVVLAAIVGMIAFWRCATRVSAASPSRSAPVSRPPWPPASMSIAPRSLPLPFRGRSRRSPASFWRRGCPAVRRFSPTSCCCRPLPPSSSAVRPLPAVSAGGAHGGRRADHFDRAHRHDLRRRQYFRRRTWCSARCSSSRWPSPSTAARSRSSNEASDRLPGKREQLGRKVTTRPGAAASAVPFLKRRAALFYFFFFFFSEKLAPTSCLGRSTRSCSRRDPR